MRYVMLSAALLFVGCGDGANLPEGCDALIVPSADDQTAVQTALIEEGPVLCFEGTYRFVDELTIDGDGLTLRGVGAGATFDFEGAAGANGIRVQRPQGFTVESLTVKNMPGDGFRVEQGQDVVFRNVVVDWDGEPSVDNGAYGIYPTECDGVLIEDSEVRGASDAGFYVGSSRNIVVRRNLAHGNVAGIEIENSMNAEVHDNEATDNTGGILVFDLPMQPAGNGGTVLVHDNRVHENNRANFAEMGTTVAIVPAGTGMMVLAMDNVEVRNNTIEQNDGAGLLVLSYRVLSELGMGGGSDPGYDPDPETIHVHDNTFSMNGAMPRDLLMLIPEPPLEDILWDGLAAPGTDASGGLCIHDNGSATFRNVHIEMFPPEPDTDVTPHDCTHPAIQPVVL